MMALEYRIYDPEIKLYYTANARATILNWRAATFLAESFQDPPPYKLDYAYLEDHIFSREELESMSYDELVRTFAQMLYARGRIGLRDLDNDSLWTSQCLATGGRRRPRDFEVRYEEEPHADPGGDRGQEYRNPEVPEDDPREL